MAGPPREFSKVAQELIADLRRIPSREPERMRKRPTRDAGDVMRELLQKHHIGQDSAEDTIRARWTEIVGPANAAYSHAAHIDQNGRRLLVLAQHSVVRNELFLHREQILEKLKKLPGCDGLKVLLIRAG
jgi:predicted nucleic acid-binding Zn ribbon protein